LLASCCYVFLLNINLLDLEEGLSDYFPQKEDFSDAEIWGCRLIRVSTGQTITILLENNINQNFRTSLNNLSY
jgi:hypothetical protein